MKQNLISFSKSLRNLRRHFEKRNGKPSPRTSDLITAARELMKKNWSNASVSTETFAFLTVLVDSNHQVEAKELLDLLVDHHPRNVAANDKFGDTLKALASKGESAYVVDLVDKLVFGRRDDGPSLPSKSSELAANESVLLALEKLASQGCAKDVSLTIHRLAIMSPKELSKNPKLRKTFETLSKLGFEEDIQLFSQLLGSKGLSR